MDASTKSEYSPLPESVYSTQETFWHLVPEEQMPVTLLGSHASPKLSWTGAGAGAERHRADMQLTIFNEIVSRISKKLRPHCQICILKKRHLQHHHDWNDILSSRLLPVVVCNYRGGHLHDCQGSSSVQRSKRVGFYQSCWDLQIWYEIFISISR